MSWGSQLPCDVSPWPESSRSHQRGGMENTPLAAGAAGPPLPAQSVPECPAQLFLCLGPLGWLYTLQILDFWLQITVFPYVLDANRTLPVFCSVSC